MKHQLARSLFFTTLLFVLVFAQNAQASCGDRPGTPKNLAVSISRVANPGAISPLAVLTWEDRASEKVWWDIEITNGSGVLVDQQLTGVGRGVEGKGSRAENAIGLPANGTRCYRVRARTGPHTEGCVSGDWSNQVCVTVGNGGPLAFGPDTCKTGFEWRETVPSDHVCVSPQSRDDAKRDNAKAAANRVPGTDTCKPGLVWREAFPNDHICVSLRKRDDTKKENMEAAANKVRP